MSPVLYQTKLGARVTRAQCAWVMSPVLPNERSE